MTTDRQPGFQDQRAGVLAALAAYIFWGLVPIYFKWIVHVGPLEIIAHRVLWAIPFLAVFLLFRDGPGFWRRLKLPLRTIAVLALSSVLVASNWLIFVWAVIQEQVLATSLGYFTGPLVNFLLGALFLGERLTRVQFVGVLIAASGTVYLGWFLGTPPWIALGLAFSFGFYGLVRKLLGVGPMIGMLWEAMILALPCFAWLVLMAGRGELSFAHAGRPTDLLLIFAGIVTVLPLVWFNVAARNLRLSTVGFFQYIAPSMTFLLSVFLFGEAFTKGHAVAFACIWAALALVSAETMLRSRRLAESRK